MGAILNCFLFNQMILFSMYSEELNRLAEESIKREIEEKS